MKKALSIGFLAALAAVSSANLRITEWMYNGTDGEFVELTNVGSTAIDMTNWSFDDDSRTPGVVSLSGFGMVAAGQSVILAEPDDVTFRASWGGLAGVSIVGGNSANLGRADEINIFDGSGALVDRLTYADANGLGPRTNNVSGNFALSHLGLNNANNAVLSVAGDSFGSWVGATGNVANPGVYTPVPEPATMAVLGLGAAAMLRRRRK